MGLGRRGREQRGPLLSKEESMKEKKKKLTSLITEVIYLGDFRKHK